MKNKTILLISPEAWGQNFVSKHHYANYLAKENTVYFINPPSTYSKNPFGTVACKTSVVKDGLIIIDYINLLPRLNHMPKWLQRIFYCKQAEQIQEELRVEYFDIIWSFDPNRFFNQNFWKADKKIYHTVDFHPNSPFEKDLAASSDLVLVVSKFLLPFFDNVSNKHFIMHGVDDDNNSESEILKGDNSLKIGFMGNLLSKNVDFETLILISTACETIADIILIGPYSVNNLNTKHIHENKNYFDQLRKLPNVYFTGSINTELLGSYLKEVDINLILYKDHSRNISPHKLLKYISYEKIILSSKIHDKDEFPENFIESINYENLSQQILEITSNLAHYNSPKLKAERRAFAEKHSYTRKITEISALLYKNE